MPDIRFRDHTEFHQQVLRATVAFAGLAAALRIVMQFGHAPPRVLVLAVAGAALLWALVPPRTAREIALAALAVAVATGLGVLAARRDDGIGFALFGGVLGLYGASQLDRNRKIASVIALAIGVPLAAMVAAVLLSAGVEDLLHPVLGWLLIGAAFGFVSGTIGALGRQLVVRRADGVEEVYEAIRGELRGELADMTERAVKTRRRVRTVLATRPAEERAPIERAVDELVRKVIDVAGRFREVDRDAEAESADALVARAEALAKKIEETSDAVARQHYQTAHDALMAQLSHLREISLSRERSLARLASYQATLDRLCLAAVHHRSADAERFAAEMRPIMDHLATAGRDLSYDAQGVAETTTAAEQAQANVIRLVE